MEWSDYEQRGKGNPHEYPCIKDSEDCGIIGFMKTVENKALMRIYRKDLTLSKKELIEKIKKLFALAENNPNEHEATMAAEKARELLEEHEIAEHELTEKIEDTEEKEYGIDGAKIPQWVAILTSITANHFNCEALIHYKRGPKRIHIKFIGTPTDIQITEYTFIYLKNTIERLSKNVLPSDNTSTRRFRESYKNGVVQGIRNNLYNLRERYKSGLKPETQAKAGDLITVKKDAIQDYKKKKYPKIIKSTHTYNPDHNAYNIGKEHGSQISINTAVNNHNKTRALE